jgi:hypothetical protein
MVLSPVGADDAWDERMRMIEECAQAHMGASRVQPRRCRGVSLPLIDLARSRWIESEKTARAFGLSAIFQRRANARHPVA